jgi:hypothetical protein
VTLRVFVRTVSTRTILTIVLTVGTGRRGHTGRPLSLEKGGLLIPGFSIFDFGVLSVELQYVLYFHSFLKIIHSFPPVHIFTHEEYWSDVDMDLL